MNNFVQCIECGESADVVICSGGQTHNFCAEHYRRRAVAMKRNADGLVLDRGAYVEPNDKQREQQSAVIKAYLGRKNSYERQKWEKVKTVGGFKPASDYSKRKA